MGMNWDISYRQCRNAQQFIEKQEQLINSSAVSFERQKTENKEKLVWKQEEEVRNERYIAFSTHLNSILLLPF